MGSEGNVSGSCKINDHLDASVVSGCQGAMRLVGNFGRLLGEGQVAAFVPKSKEQLLSPCFYIRASKNDLDLFFNANFRIMKFSHISSCVRQNVNSVYVLIDYCWYCA